MLAKKRLNWSCAAGVGSATTSVSSWLLLISFWISRGTDFALLAGVNENWVTCSTRPSGVDGSKSRDSDGESVITQTSIGHRDVGHELWLALSLKKSWPCTCPPGKEEDKDLKDVKALNGGTALSLLDRTPSAFV